jgi:hypothetical protein
VIALCAASKTIGQKNFWVRSRIVGDKVLVSIETVKPKKLIVYRASIPTHSKLPNLASFGLHRLTYAAAALYALETTKFEDSDQRLDSLLIDVNPANYTPDCTEVMVRPESDIMSFDCIIKVDRRLRVLDISFGY